MRSTINRVLNLLLYLQFCALAGIGLMLAWRLPPGSQGGRGLSVLGLDRHDWGEVHMWVGITFLITVALHLAMHWKWLRNVGGRLRAWPVWTGLAAGIALLLGFLLLPIDRDGDRGFGGRGQARIESQTGR